MLSGNSTSEMTEKRSAISQPLSDWIDHHALRRGVCVQSSEIVNLHMSNYLKSLHERRLQDIACLMFKVRHNLCPPTVKNLFSLKSSTYNLRGAEFHIPRFNTVTYGKHSLRYIGPLLWNRLSTNIKTSPSLQSFKKQICLTNLSSKLEYDCENCVLCNTWTIIWLRNALCVYLI